MYLPIHKPMDVWYTSIQNLPVVWPDLSMLGSENLRKVIGHDFHEIRTKINALGCEEPSHLTGNSRSTTWKLLDQVPLLRLSWRRNSSPIALSVMEKKTKIFYLGKRSGVLGSYGKRKSSSSRRGDSKALHLFSLLKWRCWGMYWLGLSKMRVAFRWSICNRVRKWQEYKLSSIKNRKQELLLLTSSLDGLLRSGDAYSPLFRASMVKMHLPYNHFSLLVDLTMRQGLASGAWLLYLWSPRLSDYCIEEEFM